MILTATGAATPGAAGLKGASSLKRNRNAPATDSPEQKPTNQKPATPAPAGLLPNHWAELQASAIAPDVAAANVASFGPGTDRHWESERAELVAYARLRIQTSSTTANGHPQGQAGFLADRLIRLDSSYRHLQAGGWRSLSDALPGVPIFDQWKPEQPRPKGRRDAAGRWEPLPGQSVKYEAPPRFPDGGGLLLPRIPDRCWALICERQGLPFPDEATRAAGFRAWAEATPRLLLLACEGWKKALAAVSAGYAAVALPGVTMGRRVDADGSARLIPALQLLGGNGRPWLICFDAERKPATAAKVAAAAGALAWSLRAAGGRPEIARLPLLAGADKTGLDDLLAAAGPEALDRALANTGPRPRPVLPRLRAADAVAPASQWLGDACPLPSPEVAPLVVIQAPMGCGKTRAAAAALAPLQAEGVPPLMPSHRQALGQAAAAKVGVPWCPEPDSDERLQGVAGCLDSWCPNSRLRITGDGWSGGVLLLDEWMQQVGHLLLSTGTALGDSRRVAVLRTLAEQLPRMRQTIAMDAQMSDWGVGLLERLTGRRAYLIRSDHKPMAGRALHCPEWSAADGFHLKLAELIEAGRPFLCWSSAQQAGEGHAPQTLAKFHREQRPNDLADVIDSTTKELAAELAADPDGFAERRTAEAAAKGGSWALYCSPAISSGISFDNWKPAAVIAYSGGRIAPEHAAQAVARVRSPEVPAYVFAPENSPGHALRVGSGATDPAELIAHLRAVSDPLLGVLEAIGPDRAWLQAWAELGAHRNRQNFAYRATLAGLLQAEGWELQAPGPAPCPEAAKLIADRLQAIAAAALAAEDQALIEAEPITAAEAAELDRRRRQLEPSERAALKRYKLAARWALGAAAPSLELLEADRDKLDKSLQRGWLLTTPEAVALIPGHDQQRLAALDADGRPFAPDRPRVTFAPQVAALQALGLPQLLGRFAAGETIAATDPDLIALHSHAIAYKRDLAAATLPTPAAKPTGTLRAMLTAVGWKLQPAGRIKTREGGRDTYTYRAERVALPEGVDALALAAAWLEALRRPAPPTGAKSPHIENLVWGKKAPAPPHAPPRPPLRWPLAAVVSIPWAAGPPPPGCGHPRGFGRGPAELLTV